MAAIDSIVFEDQVNGTTEVRARSSVPDAIAHVLVAGQRVAVARVVRSEAGGQTRIDCYAADGRLLQRTVGAARPPVG
jgi:hypothetical protein